MLGIKKNDTVQVIAGKDKGKSGKVIDIDRKKSWAVIENVNVIKKTVRKSDENPNGGFIEIEKPVHISNVMLIDKKTGKPTRFGIKVQANGEKVRVSKRSGDVV